MTDEERKADKFARRTIAMQLEETRKAEEAQKEYKEQVPLWRPKVGTVEWWESIPERPF